MMNGNWGKLLKVDLSAGTTEEVEVPEEDYRDYVGGSGLAGKWFFDNRGWEMPPLAAGSPLIIMNGPLSGTPYPGASRLEICGRSPLTGIWGESSMGGHFAPQLKKTGYDGIIVVGASKEPVYLHVTDEKAEIRDASHLWGKDTFETELLLKEESGDKRSQVMTIGPAGENLVKFAAIIHNRGSAAGRCGMGAVMGSKKLKGVVVKGRKKAPIADEKMLKELRSKAVTLLQDSIMADAYRHFGSNTHLEFGMAIGDVPTKNWRLAYWEDGPKNLGGTAVARTILKKPHTCQSCPISCKRIVEIEKGPYAMKEGPGSEYEAAAALGTLQLVNDREANHKANDLCNRYGMDTISAGGTIAYATEAFEKGLITTKDTGGLRLGWNHPRTLILLLEKTAFRDGIGDELAEGARSMSAKYGGQEFAPHVKGLEVPMHDPRALWGMALTYATSPRGACSSADSNLFAEAGWLDQRDLGVKSTWPFTAKGKAAQTIASQRKGTLTNSVVMCQIVFYFLGGRMEDMTALLRAATGFDYTKGELASAADRIWLLKRALGNLMGASRADDNVPRRLLEPHLEGATSPLHLAFYPQLSVVEPFHGVLQKQLKRLSRGLRSRLLQPLLERTPMEFRETLQKTTKSMDEMSLTSRFLIPNIDRILCKVGSLPGISWHNRAVMRKDPSAIKRMTVPLEKMLRDFYALRDIDIHGRPRRRRLESLGMHEVADVLHGSDAGAKPRQRASGER